MKVFNKLILCRYLNLLYAHHRPLLVLVCVALVRSLSLLIRQLPCRGTPSVNFMSFCWKKIQTSVIVKALALATNVLARDDSLVKKLWPANDRRLHQGVLCIMSDS